MSNEVVTLGEALPYEMARVRDKVLPEYVKIGPSGAIACLLIRADLDMAAKALAEGDLVEMMKVHLALKRTKL